MRDSFTYTASDGQDVSTETVSVTITGTNDTPVVIADVAVTSENASVNINVLANDSDPDTSDTLSVFQVTQGVKGEVVIEANGTVTYTPSAVAFSDLGIGESATDTFTYTASDGQGGFATGTVTMTVTGTNAAPVAVADVATTPTPDDSISVNVLANDTDADANDTLTITAVTQGENGSVVITDQIQVDTVTIAGTVEADDTYSVTVNGITFTVIAGTDTTVTGVAANDLAAVRDALVTAIDADSTVGPIVDAAAGSAAGELTLTAAVAGTPFAATAAATNGSTTLDNSATAVTTSQDICPAASARGYSDSRRSAAKES